MTDEKRDLSQKEMADLLEWLRGEAVRMTRLAADLGNHPRNREAGAYHSGFGAAASALRARIDDAIRELTPTQSQ